MCAYQLTRQGGFHAWEGCPCQDRVHTLRRGTAEAVTLCDGAGSLQGAERAAAAFSEGMNEWVADHFRTLRAKSVEEIRRLAVGQIGRILDGLTLGGEESRDLYGCTLLTVCRDCRTGEALVLHLGDGLIVGLSREEGCVCLTPPEQGEEYRSTWLVNSSPDEVTDHLRVMRIRRGRRIDAYCLMSDGSEGALYQPREEGVTLHPALESLMQEYLLRPANFAREMPDFVRTRIRPADDFSIGFLGDVPPAMLPVKGPARVRRQYARYLAARREGLTADRAARRAGWRKRDTRTKRERLLAMQVEEV